MKRLVTVLVFLPLFIWAQDSTYSLQGRIQDEQARPIPGATILLLKHTKVLQGLVADSTGHFELHRLAKETYQVQVTALGYESYTSPSFFLNRSPWNLSIIKLQPSKNTDLKEVKITGKRPLMEHDLDKTIVNVENLLSSATSHVLETLEKVPGITVNTDGTIRLNGMSSVTVLMDGKPTYLSGRDLADYLRSLPASSLDRLELMTNPSTKYDAAGSALLNIKRKKERLQGLNGSLSTNYSQGWESRTNQSVSLQYTQQKLRLAGLLSHSKDGNQTREQVDRTFTEASGQSEAFVNLMNRSWLSGHGLTGKLEIEYAFTKKTSLSLELDYTHAPKREGLSYLSKRFSQELDSTARGSIDAHSQRNNRGLSLHLQREFDRKGQEWTVDLTHWSYGNQSTQFLQNQSYNPHEVLVTDQRFRYDLPSSLVISTAKTDFIRPFASGGTLEAGLKWSHVTNDHDSRYYQRVDREFIPNYRQSNHFIYQESIRSAYVNARKKGKRWQAQAGLRLEQTGLKGEQRENPEVPGISFSRQYINLFPSIFLSYKLDSTGTRSLTLSASRRINRPNYQQLNPFLFYLDNYSYTSGNPQLLPAYPQQFELKYQHNTIWGLSFQFNQFRNIIFQTTQAVGDIFITRPGNIANGRLLSLSAYASYNPFPIWTFMASGGLVHMTILPMELYGQALDARMLTGRINVTNQLKLGKTWRAECAINYTGPSIYGQRTSRSLYRVNAGIQKLLWSNKASINLMVEDWLRSWVQREQTGSLRAATESRTSRTDTRRIGLAFAYRFGKQTRNRSYSDAAQEEKGRVN